MLFVIGFSVMHKIKLNTYLYIVNVLNIRIYGVWDITCAENINFLMKDLNANRRNAKISWNIIKDTEVWRSPRHRNVQFSYFQFHGGLVFFLFHISIHCLSVPSCFFLTSHQMKKMYVHSYTGYQRKWISGLKNLLAVCTGKQQLSDV